MDITIKNAKVHNLKGIDVTIPRNSLTVITGLSGSGKSSLAFDTLYAEGQRRYVESLSAWFAPALEVAILGSQSDCSRIQAIQIMKSFFKSYSPRSFTINHQAGRENLKYALGDLNASGEHFIVTIFVSCPSGGSFQIQQLKIDRME